jgi:xanthine dehydrogenase YagT iron-sulfur-binding subunit
MSPQPPPPHQPADAAEEAVRGPEPAPVRLRVNGEEHLVQIEPRVSLLQALRDELQLTGAKRGCDQGTCGACTVLVEGRRVLSCLTLAIGCEDQEVTTIEGLSRPNGTGNGQLHPMQEEFIAADAFQCGYCTPGQILSAVGCVREGHAGDDAEIKEWMSGNICRCAAYPHIRAAVAAARERL